MNYKRIHWLQKSLDPSADPDQGTAGRHADESASRIVRLMLFENETSLLSKLAIAFALTNMHSAIKILLSIS